MKTLFCVLLGAADEAAKFRLAPKVMYSLLTLRAFAYFSKVLARFSETPPKLRFPFHMAGSSA
jgi:hypothetical protein